MNPNPKSILLLQNGNDWPYLYFLFLIHFGLYKKIFKLLNFVIFLKQINFLIPQNFRVKSRPKRESNRGSFGFFNINLKIAN